ncbi:efflux RND transporter periplasmic adaptor subunit [Rheinheimera sp. UJ51]|uniref:efflux RND transporter periplasmic adaptor subunit n=1 Tax=Rheinheimera sp. UJ51 TaxID=2892446 RepID=UPI001E42EB15|nr:efflux RND transporter periplasmic adaptor subunit [Rheinheimera sp. UJ51]MCC5450231.1 efflux RND transporter periplasmic adaptor subunit [Rheinheimera sp. UJ51]
MQAKLALVAVVLLGSVVLTGCNKAQSSPNSTAAAEVAIPVETSRSRLGAISSSYRTTTTLTARAEADMMAKSTGIVQQVLVEEGDQVKAGQLLAVLENERQQHLLAKERAELGRLESELSRMHEMHQRKLVSTEVYEKLKWQVSAMQAGVALAELNLRETEIRAPFNAVVARRFVKTGQLINQLAPNSLFYLVSESELEAVVHLPEQQMLQAKSGQAAILSFAGVPSVTASISRVAPVVDASSGTVRTTLIIDNQARQLKAGMFSQVEIQFDTREQALLIPKRALITLDNLAGVMVLDADNRVQRRQVSLGYTADHMVEVLDGLNVGDQVVVAGHAALKEQSLVKVVSEREF